MVKRKTVKKSKTAKKTRNAHKKVSKKTKVTGKRTGKKSKGVGDVSIINEKLSDLENQAMKAYECVKAIKKRSTPDWKEWIDKLSPQDWLALASAQRERISLEIRNLSDEILSRIHQADIFPNKDSIFQNAKDSLEEIVNKIDDSELVNEAIDTAIHTKDGLLAFLNIPSHEEMVHLQRKLDRLERQMSHLAGSKTH